MRYGPPFSFARRRDGLHTGECELLGGDIGGIAVHIAARVLGLAGAGEIVCSRTVKDLVAGAGFAFADRGTHRLKGVPDSWQLYAVEPAAA
jgi:class 3 adenylate cyclase